MEILEMDKSDLIADIEMRFKQIISLTSLMMDCNTELTPNILTIQDIAQSGLNNVESLIN